MKIELAGISSRLTVYFKDYPERRFMAVWGLIFAGIFLVAFFVFFLLRANLDKISQEARDTHAAIRATQSFNISAGEHKARLDQIRESVEMQTYRLIEIEDIPSVISEISNSARSFGVALQKINSLPSAPMEGFEGYVRRPLSMDVAGDYERIGDFTGDLKNRISWFFSWERVMFRGSRQRDGSLEAHIEVTFYSRVK